MKPLSLREKAIGLVIATLMLNNIGPAQAEGPDSLTGRWTVGQSDGLMEHIEDTAAREELERKYNTLVEKMERAKETELRLQIVAKALTYVGQVRYVLTGSTPEGWDCSGFTRYVFGKFGHELEHSASAQTWSGFKTGVPQPGDLVSFQRGRGIEHIGIYVGDGTLVEATIETGTTRVVKIKDAYPADRWTLTYINIISDDLL